MTDYLEKYKEALRSGDAAEANKYYNKYREANYGDKEAVDEPVSTGEVKEDDSEPQGPEFGPTDHTVSEVKEEVEDYSDENVRRVLKLEKENKNRTTLVDHLESMVE